MQRLTQLTVALLVMPILPRASQSPTVQMVREIFTPSKTFAILPQKSPHLCRAGCAWLWLMVASMTRETAMIKRCVPIVQGAAGSQGLISKLLNIVLIHLLSACSSTALRVRTRVCAHAQSIMHRLVLAQVAAMSLVLGQGGSFVLKLFDVETPCTVCDGILRAWPEHGLPETIHSNNTRLSRVHLICGAGISLLCSTSALLAGDNAETGDISACQLREVILPHP